jgi:type IV secretory pathway TrbD component
MINFTYEDREELIIAAATGGVIGFVGGYYLDHSRGFGILIWAIVCAAIVTGMVYYLRAFRR